MPHSSVKASRSSSRDSRSRSRVLAHSSPPTSKKLSYLGSSRRTTARWRKVGKEPVRAAAINGVIGSVPKS
jgi:hypothetical protein